MSAVIQLDTLWRDAVVSICLQLPVEALFALAQSCKRLNMICSSSDIWEHFYNRRWDSTRTRKDQVEGWRGYFLRRFLFEEVWLPVPTPPGPTPIRSVHFNTKNIGEHTSTVHSIDCRGLWLVSGSADKTVRLWDRTGKLKSQRFDSHGDAVKCVKFDRYSPITDVAAPSPLLTASADKTVKYWKYSNETRAFSDVLNLRGHTEKISGVDFRSSTLAVSGGWDKTLICWDLTPGKSVRKIPNAGITSFVTSHAHTVVTSTRDKFVRVWDVRVKESTPSVTLKGHTAPVTCHHADNFWIVSGGEDSKLRWWDVRRPDPVATTDMKAIVGSIVFDDSILIAGDLQGSVAFFNMALPGKHVVTMKENKGSVEAMCFNRMNLFTSGTDKTIKAWEFRRIPPSVALQSFSK